MSEEDDEAEAWFDVTDEIWYAIPSLPKHELSSYLRMRSWCSVGRGKTSSRQSPRLLWPFRFNGYWAYGITRNGKSRPVLLHQIVAELAYGAKPPDATLVRHLDDDVFNNYASNLAYGTNLDNAIDAKRNRLRRAAIVQCDQ